MGTEIELAQPKWGTRADSPGKRGCWALTKAGTHCGATVMTEGDFCSAHAGLGIAADPRAHSARGIARSAQVRRERADLRLILGSSRLDSPRTALRAAAMLNAERLARTTLAAALDPDVPPERRARLALDIIEAVDPQARVELSTTVSREAVDSMGLAELTRFAEANGIELPE